MRFRLPVVLPQQRIRAGGSSSLFRFFCLHRRNEKFNAQKNEKFNRKKINTYLKPIEP
jgi:hypothetical protein